MCHKGPRVQTENKERDTLRYKRNLTEEEFERRWNEYTCRSD
jgi:hypothetical protein